MQFLNLNQTSEEPKIGKKEIILINFVIRKLKYLEETYFFRLKD